MSLSYFFEDLNKAYKAELEDLHSDSEGNDVLAKRLKDKRAQFTLLMPMIDSAPEMVAVAFHGGVQFMNLQALYLLSTTEPDDFPDWSQLRDTVQFSTSTQKLADQVLQEPGGERFLITTICLEYLHGKAGTPQRVESDEEEHDEGENGRSDNDEETDLDEAGADWMSQQGFDRRE
ncbi:hypothetical protein RCH09_002510 [Actimicrobium sp. GrIS 1.19]|uniref:hypothetical protein n=1 Tax=Actimicrobium sp. GrIS 1.19 TaxID=3071708 RepID=UPI002DFA53E3|nr:hypothetical protein [Actimicrobium sp. GrIS 1.19]